MKEKTINNIKLICPECNGYGEISKCCYNYVFNKKCGCCGKFCKINICDECGGLGVLTYNIGDEFEITVNIYSPDYLKDELSFHPKTLAHSKTFNGVIYQFVDKFKCKVEIDNKIFTINCNELTLI